MKLTVAPAITPAIAWPRVGSLCIASAEGGGSRLAQEEGES